MSKNYTTMLQANKFRKMKQDEKKAKEKKTEDGKESKTAPAPGNGKESKTAPAPGNGTK